jgi:ferredoxin/flavodoxin
VNVKRSRGSRSDACTEVERQMKVSIVVFSPSGNTRKVGSMLEDHLLIRGADVQLVDATGNRALFRERDCPGFIAENVKPHDVLCIGGPVYAHHMHYTVLDLIKALPPPGNGWGRYAVPFVTYGTVSSGIALEEAAKTLRKTGRSTVFAMKMDAYHCYGKIFPTDVNLGMPGDEAIPFIEDLSARIMGLEGQQGAERPDVTRELRYLSFADRVKAKVLIREGLFQRHIYPALRFDTDKCVQCGKCAEACPVLRLEIAETGPFIPKGAPQCIHCGSCIAACPSDAISFKTNMERWGNIFRKAITGRSPLASNESPKSAVYPQLQR